ncbi:MAG: antitoxin ParD1/3/4 [Acetobacteraceae bacterium]|jgi:antitoxin ParD1/3/4|nr:antitoxin ParD1/3/4 [Acetobacteraceae bacterium]
MTITLTPEQHAWIDAHIARGEFTSAEHAARQLIDERIAERAAEEEIDNLAWAKPYLDEALADVAHGKVLTHEEHESRMDAVLASMKA